MPRLIAILLTLFSVLLASGKSVSALKDGNIFSLPSAQVDRVLGSSVRSRVYTVNFYDKYERVVFSQQAVADNSIIKTSTSYDFAGNPSSVSTTTYIGNNTFTDTYTYGYDRLNRPTTVTLKHDDKTYPLISNTYDNLGRLQTPYGYLRDGVFHSYVFDYQGNVMAVVTGNDVTQTNLYYADGLPMNTSTNPTANAFKYTAKELSLFRGLPVYDYTARHTLPQINRFRTMDPLSEKYHGISPYAFCAGDPINFSDPTGMDLEITELCKGAIELLIGMINKYLDGSHLFSVNENGKASLECIDSSIKLNDNQRNFVDRLSHVINNKETTKLNLDLNSNVFIGEIESATIDVADMDNIGDGYYISNISTFTHELVEQYQYQVNLPSSYTGDERKNKAHNDAIQAEAGITNVHVSANRTSLGGVTFLDIYPFGTIPSSIPERDFFQYSVPSIATVIIEHKNGSITNCIRNPK